VLKTVEFQSERLHVDRSTHDMKNVFLYIYKIVCSMEGHAQMNRSDLAHIVAAVMLSFQMYTFHTMPV